MACRSEIEYLAPKYDPILEKYVACYKWLLNLDCHKNTLKTGDSLKLKVPLEMSAYPEGALTIPENAIATKSFPAGEIVTFSTYNEFTNRPNYPNTCWIEKKIDDHYYLAEVDLKNLSLISPLFNLLNVKEEK